MTPDVPTGSRLLRWRLPLLLLLLAALQLQGLGRFALQEPDEGRYSEIAAGMLRSGDWITPHLGGIPYYEKPPLVFWLTACSLAALGPNEFAARLPSALAALAIALMLAAWGRRVFGQPVALAAPVLLLCFPLVMVLSRIMLVDFVLAALTTGALLAAWRGLVEPGPGEAPRRPAVLAFWALAALATLAKGPVGLALPGAAIGSYLLLTRQWSRIGTLLRPSGPLLFAALVAPWYLAMSLRNPGYAYGFFIEQNLHRFTTGGSFDRQQPFWYHPLVILIGCLPASLLIPTALMRAWRDRCSTDEAGARLALFLFCSVLAPLVLLSVAKSKLAYYVLPILPPLALLVAHDLCQRLRGLESAAHPRWPWVLGAALTALVLLGLSVAVLILNGQGDASLAERLPDDLITLAKGPLLLARAHALLQRLGAAWAASGLLCAVAAWIFARGRPGRAAGTLAAGLLCVSAAFPHVAEPVGPASSARPIAELIARHARPDEPVLDFGKFIRGVSFYLGRSTWLWNATHAEFGWEIEPGQASHALQRDAQAYVELARGRSSLIVFTTAPRFEERLPSLVATVPSSTTETLGKVGRVTVHRVSLP